MSLGDSGALLSGGPCLPRAQCEISQHRVRRPYTPRSLQILRLPPSHICRIDLTPESWPEARTTIASTCAACPASARWHVCCAASSAFCASPADRCGSATSAAASTWSSSRSDSGPPWCCSSPSTCASGSASAAGATRLSGRSPSTPRSPWATLRPPAWCCPWTSEPTRWERSSA